MGLEKDQIWVKFPIVIWIPDFDREIYSSITVPRLGRPHLSYRYGSFWVLDAPKIPISRPDAGPKRGPLRG